MPDSERWHPLRIVLFLAIGALLYAGLFVWSDRALRSGPARNPFLSMASPSEGADWLILGASHAIPLGIADMPGRITQRTGQRIRVLALTGAGPFVLRLVAERWFMDHRSRGVVILLDDFAFAHRRWNRDRLGDDDLLPKIPADIRTARVLARAIPRGLSWKTWLAQVTGFARINDRRRLAPPTWSAEDRFDSSPRPSPAALRSRVAFLFPGGDDDGTVGRALDELEATILLARAQGARVVLLRPPLPDAFRAAVPEVPGLASGLAELVQRLDVPLVDHSALIPEPRYYFDTDHLNRSGVTRWLDLGLGGVLAGNDGGQ